ncbi:hypothetical protein EVAR_90175_1 [Eumeta japonica]|uniref:Uncharacterized protein n=1 Tax=Eumeta variegata TaxID=151549 RepID=A0A4C1WYK6_EUMVA|nr:hypothetical protein EVAR_90175_1 [Eumeta japonica]
MTLIVHVGRTPIVKSESGRGKYSTVGIKGGDKCKLYWCCCRLGAEGVGTVMRKYCRLRRDGPATGTPYSNWVMNEGTQLVRAARREMARFANTF